MITYWGKLKLSKIKVNDFSTIHRYDDAKVYYDKKTKKMRIDIPLELKDIKVRNMQPNTKVFSHVELRSSLNVITKQN